MHPYLPHLLSDIAAAHRHEQPEFSGEAKSFDQEMEEIEKWLESEEPAHSFSYYCGLKTKNFPPPEQLTNKEMKTVCKAFRRMLFTWNLGADFPEKLPVAWTYNFLVKTLDEKTTIPDSGFITFDYCSGYAPDCVFKEYCSCLQYWKDSTNDKKD